MHIEDLYFGSIRKVVSNPEQFSQNQIEDFSIIQDYTFFKEKNGTYKDIHSILGKYYKITYENIGDKFIDPTQLIPYNALDIIKINRTKANKSRKELLKELEKIKKELFEEFDTSKFFVGYLFRVVETWEFPGIGKTEWEKYMTGDTKCRCHKIKITIFLNTYNYEYTDLDTGKVYNSVGYKVGDVFVNRKFLIPWNTFLPLEERNTKMTKKKALTRFKELTNQTSDL